MKIHTLLDKRVRIHEVKSHQGIHNNNNNNNNKNKIILRTIIIINS